MTKPNRGKLFAYSYKDVVPLGITVLQGMLGLGIAWAWPELPVAARIGLAPLSIGLAWYNPIISTHNFIHLPFFGPRRMNSVYAALNSVNLGLPQTLYRFHHLNHHAFNNDRRGADGRTRDHSSTFAHGSYGGHESPLRYALFSLFRSGTTEAARMAVRKGQLPQLLLESGILAAALVGVAVFRPTYLLGYAVPVGFVGWTLAQIENYYEHVGASDPDDRQANAVSYYGATYNRLFCNEGYHQEHHLAPQVHWSERPRLTKRLFGVPRTVAAHPPLLGFLGSTQT